jgi:hypothetical protein
MLDSKFWARYFRVYDFEFDIVFVKKIKYNNEKEKIKKKITNRGDGFNG